MGGGWRKITALAVIILRDIHQLSSCRLALHVIFRARLLDPPPRSPAAQRTPRSRVSET